MACWAWCGCVGAGVDLELLQHLTAEAVLGEHAPDGLLDGLAGVLLEQLADRRGGEAARVAGVAVGQLVGRLVAGEGDLLGVDDDDEVTGVHVRGEDRLVLAAQQVRGLDGEAAQDDVGGVDDVPLALDVTGLGAVRAHGECLLSFVGPRRRRPAGGGAAASDEHCPASHSCDGCPGLHRDACGVRTRQESRPSRLRGASRQVKTDRVASSPLTG